MNGFLSMILHVFNLINQSSCFNYHISLHIFNSKKRNKWRFSLKEKNPKKRVFVCNELYEIQLYSDYITGYTYIKGQHSLILTKSLSNVLYSSTRK